MNQPLFLNCKALVTKINGQEIGVKILLYGPKIRKLNFKHIMQEVKNFGLVLMISKNTLLKFLFQYIKFQISSQNILEVLNFKMMMSINSLNATSKRQEPMQWLFLKKKKDCIKKNKTMIIKAWELNGLGLQTEKTLKKVFSC